MTHRTRMLLRLASLHIVVLAVWCLVLLRTAERAPLAALRPRVDTVRVHDTVRVIELAPSPAPRLILPPAVRHAALWTFSGTPTVEVIHRKRECCCG